MGFGGCRGFAGISVASGLLVGQYEIICKLGAFWGFLRAFCGLGGPI